MRTFLCRGKLQVGPDPKNLIVVILLINVTNLLSFAFSWIDYVLVDGNFFPLAFGLVLWISIDILLYKAATSDPGLIPR